MAALTPAALAALAELAPADRDRLLAAHRDHPWPGWCEPPVLRVGPTGQPRYSLADLYPDDAPGEGASVDGILKYVWAEHQLDPMILAFAWLASRRDGFHCPACGALADPLHDPTRNVATCDEAMACYACGVPLEPLCPDAWLCWHWVAAWDCHHASPRWSHPIPESAIVMHLNGNWRSAALLRIGRLFAADFARAFAPEQEALGAAVKALDSFIVTTTQVVGYDGLLTGRRRADRAPHKGEDTWTDDYATGRMAEQRTARRLGLFDDRFGP
jgi:hypothetical protein